LQLARAQKMIGDQVTASRSYEEFLTLWKGADRDIPIYRQAKAEYASLRKHLNSPPELKELSNPGSRVPAQALVSPPVL
jgi:hypothetical protein